MASPFILQRASLNTAFNCSNTTLNKATGCVKRHVVHELGTAPATVPRVWTLNMGVYVKVFRDYLENGEHLNFLSYFILRLE
jgi:hypothetical protein